MKRLAAMGALRLSLYLKQNGEPDYYKKFLSILTNEITSDEIMILENNYMKSIYEETGNLNKLMQIIKPDDEEGHLAWLCFELAILHYMEKQAGEVFNHISPGTREGVTMGLVAKIVYGDREFLDKFGIIRKAYDRIELLFQVKPQSSNMIDVLFSADDRLIDWLAGENNIELLKSRFVTVYNSESAFDEKVIFENKINQTAVSIEKFLALNSDKIPVVVVSGDELSGRRFTVKRIVDRLDKNIIFADMIYLGDIKQVVVKWRSLLREAMFNDVSICITGINMFEHTVAYIRILTEEYMRYLRYMGDSPLFLTVDKSVKVTPMIKNPVINIELPIPNVSQRKEAWDIFIEKYFEENRFNTKELAVKMKLPIGKIEKIVNRIYCSNEDNPYDSHKVFKYCYEMLDDGRYDGIKRVESIYKIDDLKLEQSQKSIIQDICNQVEFRQRVLEEWNLRSKYAYGTSVSALFSGPPGTGKTMAVHVIAGILGLELFKVDLSQIVDKYIGETEKKLEEVFNKAEQSNMILFFDEADSIIGKRSEVNDSKDKYANTEVSYLLQKIEEYDGIVILATNYSQNIDAAIMRRIRFTVHFPLPDETTRREIWMSAFPDEVPQEGIDYDYLASQFEFSGGQIKNVVLNAIFFAAAEDEAVQMKHMVKAIKLELTKDKKVSFQDALGEYAHIVF